MSKERKCSNCDYCILQDFGYSNYTVEGRQVICSKNLNPHGEFDRWYGEDARDLFAAECEVFSAHEGPVRIDVEAEDRDRNKRDESGGGWDAYASRFISAEAIKQAL